MGIGGGFFMLIYQRSIKKISVIDARETAPKNAFEDMYSKNQLLSMEG
jgi:gamma-glutamyltranspeptidase